MDVSQKLEGAHPSHKLKNVFYLSSLLLACFNLVNAVLSTLFQLFYNGLVYSFTIVFYGEMVLVLKGFPYCLYCNWQMGQSVISSSFDTAMVKINRLREEKCFSYSSIVDLSQLEIKL